jgi:hypothetical protein
MIDSVGKGAFFASRKVASSATIPILAIANLTALYFINASAPIRIKKLTANSRQHSNTVIKLQPILALL